MCKSKRERERPVLIYDHKVIFKLILAYVEIRHGSDVLNQSTQNYTQERK